MDNRKNEAGSKYHAGGRQETMNLITLALRGTDTIFSKKYISFHNSFMLTPIDLVMVSKESSFKELSNGMHFNQVQHIPGMVNVS